MSVWWLGTAPQILYVETIWMGRGHQGTVISQLASIQRSPTQGPEAVWSAARASCRHLMVQRKTKLWSIRTHSFELTMHTKYVTYNLKRGPGSSVGIVTDYGLDGPGSNPGGDEIFRPVQTGPGAHPASCKMGTGSFPGVKCGQGVLLTTHPLLVQRSWKSRAIPLPTLWATPGL